MSDTEGVNTANASNEEVSQNDKSRTKRGKGRVSTIDRMKEEGEALLKAMETVPEVEGRRRTRSSARGSVPATPPPPAKKERKTPIKQGKTRGRPKKNTPNAKDTETDETDSQDESKDTIPETVEKTSEDKSEDTESVENKSEETNTHSSKETAANNNAESGDKTDASKNSVTENSDSAENGAEKEAKNENSVDEEDDSVEKMETSEVCEKKNNAVGEPVSIEKSTE